MGSSPDNDSVEKILRLKRHEQPPPRYFQEFSGRVTARIERGEAHLSWWERLGFDLRPAIAAGAGVVACSLIIYGVATTDGEAVGAPGAMSYEPGVASQSLLANAEQGVVANSTNPVSAYGQRLDQSAFPAKIVPASFQIPSPR